MVVWPAHKKKQISEVYNTASWSKINVIFAFSIYSPMRESSLNASVTWHHFFLSHVHHICIKTKSLIHTHTQTRAGSRVCLAPKKSLFFTIFLSYRASLNKEIENKMHVIFKTTIQSNQGQHMTDLVQKRKISVLIWEK